MGLSSAREVWVMWPLPMTVICFLGPLQLPSRSLRLVEGGGVGWGGVGESRRGRSGLQMKQRLLFSLNNIILNIILWLC